ncbi:MAG: DEAD/DEAH box helicase family protein [bacterium]|nr:DEAD/DEAH box helicase family protein [bacterium]
MSGKQVRLKTDPTRIGYLTGKSQQLGPVCRLQVQFPDGNQFYPENMLESVSNDLADEDPLELLKTGKFKGIEHLRGALTHSRLTGKLANLIYSMEASNTDFYPYQFKPVLNYLESPSRGILIADEVGLGKTIEAGLIWTEVRAREQAKTLLVVCPAMLRNKWEDELQNRFGIQAKICNADELLSLLKKHDQGSIKEFAAIISMQALRPPKGWEAEEVETAAAKVAAYFDEKAYQAPLFDLTIIDEAHYFRNPESQTSKLGKLLRPVSDGVVLLSATPIQLKNQDLYELLHLIDENSFNNLDSFQRILTANKPLVDLRESILRNECDPESFVSNLESIQKHSFFRNNRQIAAYLANPPESNQFLSPEFRAELAEKIEKINLLNRSISRTRKREVHEWRVLRDTNALRAEMNTDEERFYEQVTEKVRSFCISEGLSEGLILTIPQRQISSSMPAALRSWLNRHKDIDNELLWETGTESSRKTTGPLISELISISKDLGVNFEKLKSNDTKFKLVLQNLKDYWANYPNQKVIIFSFYKETLSYLEECFAEASIETIKVIGGMSREDKQQVLSEFASSHGPSLLLASEVASEGVDLQFCSLLINYDLPWNPMRVEQRIGRIDRIGQKAEKILIWNLFYQDTIDDRIYGRLFDRLQIFKHALGDMEAVLGIEINKLTQDLFLHQLSRKEEEERIAQTEQAIANINKQNSSLEESAGHLLAHGSYILNQVKAAKELGRYIKGFDIYTYCRDFLSLQYPGTDIQIVDEEKLACIILLSKGARQDFSDYLSRNPQSQKTRVTTQTTSGVNFVFSNKVETSLDEYITQMHPLVRFISESIQNGKASYFPVVCSQVPQLQISEVEKGDYAFVIKRWSVAGAKTQEHLVIRAANIKTGDYLPKVSAEKLLNAASLLGSNIVSSATAFDNNRAYEIVQELIVALDKEGAAFHEEAVRTNDDYIDQQILSFTEHINAQIRKIEQRILRLAAEGKTKVIPANKGKIAKLEERLFEKTEYLDGKRKIFFDPRDVSLGVVRVA